MNIKNSVDRQYFNLISKILEEGCVKVNRTGMNALSIFDYTMKFDMNEGFPLLTSKKMFTKGITHELIWFLRGETNIKYLVDNDVHIWDGDAYKSYVNNRKKYIRSEGNRSELAIESLEKQLILSKEDFIDKIKIDNSFAKVYGDLGPIYGRQWRKWGGYKSNFVSDGDGNIKMFCVGEIDQISNLINDLKNNPDSRRLMVSAWNVAEIDQMTLPPCHYGFQCYTSEISIVDRRKIWCDSINKDISYADDFENSDLDKINIPKRRLSLKFNMRSVDCGLGLPFNIASYGLLLHLLSREVNMIANELIFSGGDCHIYLNHIDQVKSQLNNQTFTLPKISLTNKSINDLKFEDIEIVGYVSSGSVKMPLSN